MAKQDELYGYIEYAASTLSGMVDEKDEEIDELKKEIEELRKQIVTLEDEIFKLKGE